MARIKMDKSSGIAGISGRIGNIVFRMSGDGTTYAQQAAAPTKRPGSAAQQQWRSTFQEAVAYGKEQQASVGGRAYYQPYVRAGSFSSVYGTALSDFTKTPQVLALEVGDYRGQVGACLRVQAYKPCGVVAVRVRVLDAAGQVLEEGEAIHEAGDWWTYKTKQVHSASAVRQVQATAQDRPGRTEGLVIGME